MTVTKTTTSKKKTLGQVATPKELVTLTLNAVGFTGDAVLKSNILEPSFGSGAFLIEIVKRILTQGRVSGMSNDTIAALLDANVWGVEIDKPMFDRAIKRLNSLIASYGIKPLEWSHLICGDMFECFDEFEGADFIVGNPPFVNVHTLDEEQREHLKGLMRFSQGIIDTYIAFYDIGLRLLRDNGRLAFISPNTFLRSNSHQEFRDYLIAEQCVCSIYDFKASRMFESADTYTCVCVISKERAAEIHCRDYNGYDVVNDFTIDADEFYNNYIGKPWYLYPKQHRDFLEANAAQRIKLDDVAEVQNGIATLLDSVYVGTLWFDRDCTIPYDDSGKQEELWFWSNEGDVALIERSSLLPCVKGSTADVNKQREYIIFPYIIDENGNATRFPSEDAFKAICPLACTYLLKHKERLLARDIDNSTKWFEYGRSQGLKNINATKIVFKMFIADSDETITPSVLDAKTLVYSGLYIAPQNPSEDTDKICAALSSREFVTYLKLTGENKSGGYTRIGSTKVIKAFGVSDYIDANPLRQNSIFKENYCNVCNGLDLLADVKNNTIKTVFFDPQYRGLFDKMNYGNEGERQTARSELPQMDTDTIHAFLKEIYRVLAPSGYLFLWVDKFHLVEGITPWLSELPELQTVDLITWDKERMGMGYRTRRQAEYLLVIQKQPLKAKATWVRHDIPDVWSEQAAKTHPHAKPIGLQEQLILATTREGDYVLDPASGSYSVKTACEHNQRNFIGCDLLYG